MTPWTIQFMEFSNPGTELGSPALQADSLPAELSRKQAREGDYKNAVYPSASVCAADPNAFSLSTEEGTLKGHRVQNKTSFLDLKIGNDCEVHYFNQNCRSFRFPGMFSVVVLTP